MKPRNKGLISKTARSTNARKKTLMVALQVSHLLPQNLDVCVNGINSRLNLPHKEGSGNLTEMIQNELHSKAHVNKLLNRSTTAGSSRWKLC